MRHDSARRQYGHEYRPGWKMYQVVWERDGERLATYALHATNEADALSRAEASLAEHPEHDFDRTGPRYEFALLSRSALMTATERTGREVRNWHFASRSTVPRHV